jgi:MFS family permease
VRRRARTPTRAPLPGGFGTIWSTVAVDLVGFGIILPVLPLYAERFGASPATVGALFASFSVAQLLLAPVWGAVSDRVGRKPVLLVSLAGTAAGSLLTGVAGSLPVLFFGRVLDGASGASVSVAQAAVADLSEPDQRARLFGLLGAAFGLGFVAGPALGALAALGGPRVPFLVAAGVAGANALVALRRLPETMSLSRAGPHPRPPCRERAPAPSGAVEEHNDRATPAAGPPARSPSRRPSVALADGLGAEGLGGLDPGAVGDPEPLAHHLARSEGGDRRRGVGRLVAVAFGSLMAFSAFEATFALFGERRLGFRLASTGAVFTVVGLALAVVEGGLVHPVVHRLGESRTLRLGLLANALGLGVLAAVHSWWVLVPALAALVVGQGLATPSLTAAVAAVAGDDRRGGVLGLQQSAGGLARVLGPLAGGLAFEHLGLPSPYLAGAGVMVACAALVSG